MEMGLSETKALYLIKRIKNYVSRTNRVQNQSMKARKPKQKVNDE